MGRVVRTLKHGWNVFKDPPQEERYGGVSSSVQRRPHSAARYFNDRSIIGSIYTRLALDVSSVEFYHAMLDENDVAVSVVRDSLNDCLTLDPNIDQSAQALKQDIAMTMFEQGTVAIVPTDANINPAVSTSYDIKSIRAGRVSNWRPRHATVEIYDDREFDEAGNPVNGGIVKQITMPKDQIAIVENPFYDIMNTPNGTLQRLLRKLALLDGIDEAAGSGKLDMIIQLPYAVRGASRQNQAKERRDDLAAQLKDDDLGIGYIDVSEKVIQLNRQIDNKLLDQIETLTKQLYDQLGLTPEIMNRTASRDVMNAYLEGTIEPIANAIALEMKRKFLTKTARTQRHSIEIYRDPLKLIPLGDLPEVADKLIRNEVVTTNELRPKIGLRPHSDPKANELRNPNMPVSDQPGGGLDGTGLPGSFASPTG